MGTITLKEWYERYDHLAKIWDLKEKANRHRKMAKKCRSKRTIQNHKRKAIAIDKYINQLTAERALLQLIGG